jgi:XTP/dITP diphosphohydrolase
VLATTNRGKIREFEDAFGRVRLIPLSEFEGVTLPEETGDTFEANARAKAIAAARATGLPALADDSGLAVDALGGAPGVRSARFAGPGADDLANRALLTARLRGAPPWARTARFICSLVLALPDGSSDAVEGTCAGRLLDRERGNGGFGYDPLFVPDGYDRTFAEMSREEKEALSHRGRAILAARDAFVQRIEAWTAARAEVAGPRRAGGAPRP